MTPVDAHDHPSTPGMPGTDAGLFVAAPRVEHREPAIGIGSPTPRLSWVTTAPSGCSVAGYEMQVEQGGVITTTAVTSDQSVLVPWPGTPLRSRERAEVRVRALPAEGPPSPWSPPTVVEAGLLDPLDWVGMGAQPPWEDGALDDRRPPILRRSFAVRGAVERARLYVTAHGVYEMELNGRRVGEDVLNPGWTVYPERLRYQTYDITELLAPGENVVGAWLGDGWWRGRYGFDGGTANIYGSDIALMAQLEIDFVDGTRTVVATDDRWRCARSPVLRSSLYTGETFDERELQDGWSAPGFDDTGWEPVRVALFAKGTLVAPDGPPVRCTEELAPVAIGRTATGSILVDLGQNHSGRLRIRARTGVTSELVVRHAELLQDGELYVRTLRGATSVDRYLGSGGAIDWEPRFTIHGFRYAEITGYEGDLEQLSIVSRVYHSDLRRTGWLETSDASLNRLHENVRWSLRSNFVDIPTDCPQRDERLGWTGDIQVFAPTASYLYDVSGFLSSWLTDLAIEQRRHGTVPWYVPVIPGGAFWDPSRPGAAWGDAAALTPWTLWERYGDQDVLAAQYASARAWVDQVERLVGPSRLWNSGIQLGDWLDPNAPQDDPSAALTDRYLVATAFFARSARRVADTARQLGDAPAHAHYDQLADEVGQAFRTEWGTGAGGLTNETQTAYALAIAFDLLVDPSERQRAGEALATLVIDNGYRIGAGFAGVNLVADALTATGHVDVAFSLLLEDSTPSWLSMVNKGATTIWERWDSLMDDGTVNPGDMTSFNHYALGSVADWMHRTIGGIQPTSPGYRTVRIAPSIGGGLTWSRARHDSPYGTIRCEWALDGSTVSTTVEIPVGVRAVLRLPGSSAETALEAGEFTFRSEV